VLLYDSSISGNCYKVRLLLAHLGIDYERRELSVTDRSDRAEVIGRDNNPDLRVPTIVLDDGRPLAESNAIMWFFAEGTPYLPDDAYERAQVLQWMFFEQYSHEPKIAVLRFWMHYDSSPHTEEEMAPLRAAGNNALAAMDRHLSEREFFVGDRYSIADIALYAYTHNADETGFEPGANVVAWLERVRSQPGHVRLSD
jgi:glutathione S-transferase